MISHVHVGVDDFERAFAFYSAVLPELGLELKFKEPENGWAGWMTPGVARRCSWSACRSIASRLRPATAR